MFSQAKYFVRHRVNNAPVYLLSTGKLMPQCICKTQAIAIAAWLWRWDFAQRKANNKRWLPKNGPRIVKATLKSNYSDYCGLLLSGQFYLNSVKRWSLPSRLFVRDSIYLQEMLRWNKQVSIVEYSTTEGQSDTSTALNYLARSEHVQPRAPGGDSHMKQTGDARRKFWI